MKNPFSGLFRARDKPRDAVSSAPSFYFGSSASGKSVTPSSAVQVSAVYACVRVIAETIANAALQEGFIDAVMTEPAAGVTNAAFEHRVDPEDAKAKYQSWVDRHKPMRRSVRNEAPQAAPTEPRTSASDLQGRLDRLKYTY